MLQKHHGSREVFLTDTVDNNEMECLDEIVPVCLPGSEHTFDGYLDVYTCEYEYDATWQVQDFDCLQTPPFSSKQPAFRHL